jgi:hypothetical protein
MNHPASGPRSRHHDLATERVADQVAALGDGWRVAVRPRFRDECPDVLALHASYGACAITVRDWPVGRYRQGPDGAIEQRLGQWWQRVDGDPRRIARQQRRAIFEQFFGAETDSPYDPSVVRAVVVLARHTTAEACALLRRPQMVSPENWVEVWGGEAVAADARCVIIGDPRARAKAVPMRPYLELERFVAGETLQPA